MENSTSGQPPTIRSGMNLSQQIEILDAVMREAVDVLSGAMDYWCTVVCNHTLFPDDQPCSKTD